MQKAIDPKLGIAAIVVILLAIGGVVFATSRAPAPVKAQDVYSAKVLADPDPPRPGMPGYHRHQ
ncbi:MAG TPA: hypothetical protein VG944_15775 [Fimbriimonas sp.]|nr:hypothetical protein [Fimbriimonas sp.]